jgi:predicted ThiF/HesA family dinucleotide-utilizing enzyme
MSQVKEKNEFIEKLKILDEAKDTIITEIQCIQTIAITKTQAQNLREYAVQTNSIEEILLYIDYQYARNLKNEKAKDPQKRKENKEYNYNLKCAINDLKKCIYYYKNKYPAQKEAALEIVRYLLGIFARHVMIQSKERGE